MKRKIYKDLIAWKNSNTRTAFFIDGARRVGKSYIAKMFAKNEYKSYIMIDFYNESDDLKHMFIDYKNDLDSLFLNLSIYYNTPLYERNTLFIFDEIQFFPFVRGLIKYLIQDGRYDFIETGSLVSIKKNVKDIMIPSEEHHVLMSPMDFEEFLIALDKENLVFYIKEQFEKMKSIPDAIHRQIMQLFRTYLIVGGMPQAVLTYINLGEVKDFSQVEIVKQDILTLYKNYMRKYADGYERKVEDIFNSIPALLSNHEKKFSLTSINKDYRVRDYEEAIFWLIDAGIINVAYNVTEPNLGLKLNEDRKTFKCYMSDTGLLLSHAFGENPQIMNEIYKKIILNKLDFNEGMIIENVVAQLLKINHNHIYFYSKYSKENSSDRMEIDFVIPKIKITSRKNVDVIEVKSGIRYTYKSLEKYSVKFADYINKKYIIHTDNLKEENGIVFLPIYMTTLL